jgi:CRISPR-associated protein Cas5t
MLYLRVRAPFGAFRIFTAGSFRPTASFVTPSAAYGLLLNLAGIESRLDDGESVATLTRPDLPRFEIALGALAFPEPQSLFQQLHNYPVGKSGQENQEHETACYGSKYNIQPVRREFLSGIDVCLAVRGNDNLEHEVRSAVALPGASGSRYGVPFLGDNAFLVDRLDLLEVPPEAYWYKRLGAEEGGVREGLCRLTVWVDRTDASRSVAALFYPGSDRTTTIPEEAWVEVGPSQAD